MAEGYTIKHVDEFEEMEGSGGATWRLARKTLEAEAFGFNIVDIEAGGQIPAHNHSKDDQEEVYVILEEEGFWWPVTRSTPHLPARSAASPRGEPNDPEPLRCSPARSRDRRPGEERLRTDALGLSPTRRLEPVGASATI